MNNHPNNGLVRPPDILGLLHVLYKTTTLKYTVDDIPLLSNIQPFLQIYDDTEKAVHAFL